MRQITDFYLQQKQFAVYALKFRLTMALKIHFCKFKTIQNEQKDNTESLSKSDFDC